MPVLSLRAMGDSLEAVLDDEATYPTSSGSFIHTLNAMPIAVTQRNQDFAILQQVAEAVEDIDRYTYYLGVRRCGGCGFVQGHDGCCPWLKLAALGIVEVEKA